MRKLLSLAAAFAFLTVSAFSADLDPAYRQNYGENTIVATNGDYPPVDSCNKAQFDWRDGASHVDVSFDEIISLRSILPDGKRFNDYYQQVKQEQGQNLQNKVEDVFYYRIWTDRDENGNPIEAAKKWPTAAAPLPSWPHLGWFTTSYDSEAGTWDTVGVNRDAFRENLMQYFSTAKPGQKFYIALSVGYSYKVGAGQPETKWNHVLNKMETVVSSGELGFAVSKPVSFGTIIIRANKTGN